MSPVPPGTTVWAGGPHPLDLATLDTTAHEAPQVPRNAPVLRVPTSTRQETYGSRTASPVPLATTAQLAPQSLLHADQGPILIPEELKT